MDGRIQEVGLRLVFEGQQHGFQQIQLSYLSLHILASPSSNSLIGYIEAARKVFDVSPQRGVDAWNAMIIAYSRKEYPDEVLNLFCQMILEDVRTDNDILTFMVALKACTRLLDLKTGDEIWCRAMDCGI